MPPSNASFPPFIHDTYGEVTQSSGSSQTVFGFIGEETDGNGLVNLRARYYNPTLGQFMELDPVEGASCTPMSLNRYMYVQGNVINMVDPSGMYTSPNPNQWNRCYQSGDPCLQYVPSGPYQDIEALVRCVSANYCAGKTGNDYLGCLDDKIQSYLGLGRQTPTPTTPPSLPANQDPRPYSPQVPCGPLGGCTAGVGTGCVDFCRDSQQTIVAHVIYAEVGSLGNTGMADVAQVIRNRMKSSTYLSASNPLSVVARYGGDVTKSSSFQFTNITAPAAHTGSLWDAAYALAGNLMNNDANFAYAPHPQVTNNPNIMFYCSTDVGKVANLKPAFTDTVTVSGRGTIYQVYRTFDQGPC